MKRTCISLAGILACAASAATVATVASAQGSLASPQRSLPTAHTSRFTTIELRHTSLGKILVTASGFTLYEFTKDHANKSSCATISGCPEAWPALQTNSKPTAGSGLKASLLSTIKLSSGGKQVTYAGHPLYIYSGDSGPGETSYVGAKQFGGTWYAIDASGGTVK
jgi:predicted lipoprotein with Yx(FWY)xxD motif